MTPVIKCCAEIFVCEFILRNALYEDFSLKICHSWEIQSLSLSLSLICLSSPWEWVKHVLIYLSYREI